MNTAGWLEAIAATVKRIATALERVAAAQEKANQHAAAMEDQLTELGEEMAKSGPVKPALVALVEATAERPPCPACGRPFDEPAGPG